MEPRLVALLDAHFDEDLERSVRIEPGRWDRRTMWQRGLERAITPLRAWF